MFVGADNTMYILHSWQLNSHTVLYMHAVHAMWYVALAIGNSSVQSGFEIRNGLIDSY